jgi:hypothetical protein
MSRYEGASTEKANIIGVDLAKHVFHVHGACRDGSVAFRKKISRHIWICRSSFGCRGSLSSGLSGGSGLNLGPECLASGPCQNHRGSALIANAIIRLTWPSTPLGPTHHHVDVPGRTSACHFGLPGARLLRRC